MFMTAYLQLLVDAGVAVDAVGVDGGWFEVDTVEDLTVYEQLRSDGRLRSILDPEAIS